MFFQKKFQDYPVLGYRFHNKLGNRGCFVSRTRYRMKTPELLELRMQLQELLHKGYIKPSVSP